MKIVYLFLWFFLSNACGESRDNCEGSTTPIKQDPIHFEVFSPTDEKICDAIAMLTVPGLAQKITIEPMRCNEFLTNAQKEGSYKIEIQAKEFKPFEQAFSISSSKTDCGRTVYSGYHKDVKLEYADPASASAP